MSTRSLKKKINKKTYVSFMLAEESHKEIFSLNYNSVSLPLYTCCVCFDFGTYVKASGTFQYPELWLVGE